MSAPPYPDAVPPPYSGPPPIGMAPYPPIGGGYGPPGMDGPPAAMVYPPINSGYGPPPNQGYGPPANQGYGLPANQGYGPPPQQPITTAPGAYPPIPNAGYGPAPVQPNANWSGGEICPPGLQYLTMVDQLLVHQKVELLEAFTSFETSNKYEIKNSMGQKVYYAKEDTDCCTRMCCGPQRQFDMKISDNSGNEVIHLYRPLRCDSCLFPCFLQKLEVMSPPGSIIGYVVQEWSIFTPKFRIENANQETILRIEGPFCTFSICGDVEFKVLSKDGLSEVGRITKQWAGLIREAFTDSDHFGISFPIDLDVKMKAVLLGACFLIDFMFFEKKGNKERDTPGMF